MSWWSKKLKIVVFIIVGLLLLTGVIVMVQIILSPLVACTLVGCSGGIDVELSGLPSSSSYQIELTLPSGETQTLTCDPNALIGSNTLGGSGCKANGVFFRLQQDSAPKDITVIVTINGKQNSESFHPTYQKFQPNSRNCPPVCYSATIKMNLPQ